MSAILPPKRPPKSSLKLQLPGTPSSDPPTPSNRPKLSLVSTPTPEPPSTSSTSNKPSLKLSSVSNKLSALSLNVPSRYASALNGPSESDTELDDNDDSRPWALGEQERMAGELLDVINGPSSVGLEDELSGKTRRPRSASRVSSSRPSSSGSNAAGKETSSTNLPMKVMGGNGMLSPPLTSAIQVSSVHSKLVVEGGGGNALSDGGLEDDHEDELDISPTALQDLGRLGEGASGEVRKVLHKPTGLVMAKKVSTTLAFSVSHRMLKVVENHRRSRLHQIQNYTNNIYEN